MSKFLDDLKIAADKGVFNSDAAKKINEIADLADTKIDSNSESGSEAQIASLKEKLEKRLENNQANSIEEEKGIELNSDYEKKMEELKKQDGVNVQLATLIEIEDMVKASIQDMFSFIKELDTKFEKEFDGENKMFGDLNQKIEEIKSKYNSIINN